MVAAAHVYDEHRVVAALGAAGAGLAALLILVGAMQDPDPPEMTEEAAPAETAGGSEEMPAILETDGVLHTIPLEKIRSGGPPKTAYPP